MTSYLVRWPSRVPVFIFATTASRSAASDGGALAFAACRGRFRVKNPLENQRKTIGKPGKTIGKWRFNPPVNCYIANWKDPPCYKWVNPRTKSPFSVAFCMLTRPGFASKQWWISPETWIGNPLEFQQILLGMVAKSAVNQVGLETMKVTTMWGPQTWCERWLTTF